MKNHVRTFVCLAVLVTALAGSSRDASAGEIFEIWAAANGGGAMGGGSASVTGGSGSLDFFDWVQGPVLGVEGGVKLVFISAFVDYTRFFGDTGGGLLGLNLGGDGTIKLVDELRLVLRLAGTFYLGDLEQKTRGNITSDEINTMGVGARGGIGLRYTFFKVLSVGITPQVGYHYFFGGASNTLVTTLERGSHGWDFQGIGYVRIGWGA